MNIAHLAAAFRRLGLLTRRFERLADGLASIRIFLCVFAPSRLCVKSFSLMSALSVYPLLENEPLAKYTAARLGGPADLLYVARESNEALIAVVEAAWAEGVPVRVIGGGANVLVSDEGVRGLVVVNRVGKMAFRDETVTVTAGTSLSVLARKCAARGLAGFEWAVSVPGTVGGAVVNNAGAHGGDLAGCLRSAVVIDAEAGTQLLKSLISLTSTARRA